MKQLLIILSFILPLGSFSQELDCNVSVNSSRMSGTNKEIFTTLQTSLNDLMNNTIWTNFVYETEERIECNILLDLIEQSSANEFKGKLQIQARRPVYGSSYNTVIFNYIDTDVRFTYAEFDPIEVSENTFTSNLSSLLTFYAYIIIGLDNDTFSPQGGEEAFMKAEKIVTAAQNSGYSGWLASDDTKRKNRYWLVDNLLNTDYEVLRDFNYSYHRLGLDLMEKSVERGRAGVSEAVLMLDRFNRNKPDPFMHLLSVIMESKSDELVNIFSESPEVEKDKMMKILLEIDPGSARKYNTLSR